MDQIIATTPIDVMENFIRMELKITDEEKDKLVEVFRGVYLLAKDKKGK
jgi:hypothetical protein